MDQLLMNSIFLRTHTHTHLVFKGTFGDEAAEV